MNPNDSRPSLGDVVNHDPAAVAMHADNHPAAALRPLTVAELALLQGWLPPEWADHRVVSGLISNEIPHLAVAPALVRTHAPTILWASPPCRGLSERKQARIYEGLRRFLTDEGYGL
jgi:site-specific DNA-cytosine methylase